MKCLHTGAIIGLLFISSIGIKAEASVRHGPIPVKLGTKNTCWKYHGLFDGFTVHVNSGDRLIISSTGEAHFSNGVDTWETVQPRDITVSKPPRSNTDNIWIVRPQGEPAVYSFDTGGDYDILLGPQAIRGMQSTVVVCRAPRV